MGTKSPPIPIPVIKRPWAKDLFLLNQLVIVAEIDKKPPILDPREINAKERKYVSMEFTKAKDINPNPNKITPIHVITLGPYLSISHPWIGPNIAPSALVRATAAATVVLFHPNSDCSGKKYIVNPWNKRSPFRDCITNPDKTIHQPKNILLLLVFLEDNNFKPIINSGRYRICQRKDS